MSAFTEPQVHEEVEVDLFSSDPIPAPAPQTRPRPAQATSNRPYAPSAPSQPTRPTRKHTLPPASPSSLALALRHKQKGTEAFKLGQYAPAADAYSAAIDALPAGHLLLVPLFTNRALVRLRTGEYAGAGEDAGGALGVILGLASSSDAPGLVEAGRTKANEGGWTHPLGVGVDLGDGYVKALKRRAEAWEGREKWVEAGRDWEVLAGAGWVAQGVRGEAVRGAGRCRRMVSGSGASSGGGAGAGGPVEGPVGAGRKAPAVKPKPKPMTMGKSEPSKALLAHRGALAQAERDDNAKHALKDGVDARIAAWKTGKETNIRALLSSLDQVLWPEVVGVKMGLHELVMPAHVKKGYVRAIGKVHPDKLNASNSTVEQRMLANAVFGTLNEAWIAFQNGK
ncbi:DnaJ domain-containing protein [Crassisporium funariophilum]|nr:DnaJ domain-containing protein [Crassisporium funariophilum]